MSLPSLMILIFSVSPKVYRKQDERHTCCLVKDVLEFLPRQVYESPTSLTPCLLGLGSDKEVPSRELSPSLWSLVGQYPGQTATTETAGEAPGCQGTKQSVQGSRTLLLPLLFREGIKGEDIPQCQTELKPSHSRVSCQYACVTQANGQMEEKGPL